MDQYQLIEKLYKKAKVGTDKIISLNNDIVEIQNKISEQRVAMRDELVKTYNLDKEVLFFFTCKSGLLANWYKIGSAKGFKIQYHYGWRTRLPDIENNNIKESYERIMDFCITKELPEQVDCDNQLIEFGHWDDAPDSTRENFIHEHIESGEFLITIDEEMFMKSYRRMGEFLVQNKFDKRRG